MRERIMIGVEKGKIFVGSIDVLFILFFEYHSAAATVQLRDYCKYFEAIFCRKILVDFAQ